MKGPKLKEEKSGSNMWSSASENDEVTETGLSLLPQTTKN